MSKELLLTAIVKQEDKGYSVVCPELGVASQGETFEESISNIKEAAELYIESAEQLGIMDEVLDQLGITKQKGSHISLHKRLENGKIILVVVPRHKEIKKGTFLSIIKQSGMPREAFISKL